MSKYRKTESLSDQLRWHIDHSGQTQHQIANRAGIDPGVLSRFMRGERTIVMRTADRLAAHLGLRLVHDEDRI